jgi:uncharacterized protein involved in type VI secretion and phage assembly
MALGFLDAAAGGEDAAEPRLYGVAVAEVIGNVDTTGGARVQLRLPWMPGYEPWARVAALFAGNNRGAFFMPQVGDEVLVAFNHGDVRDPYVLGGLWNGQDSPPATGATDATSKRVIRTPAGHEIELDDTAQSVTVTTSSGQKLVLGPEKIELKTNGDTATLTMETSGRIQVKASTEIELKATSIKLNGTALDLKASASATLDGGGACDVKAGLVRIN